MFAEQFLEGNTIFEYDNTPAHADKVVTERHYAHFSDVSHIQPLQTPYMNTIEFRKIV